MWSGLGPRVAVWVFLASGFRVVGLGAFLRFTGTTTGER